MRFLIDECLPISLTAVANAAGYEAAHVARIGKQEWKDWSLARYAVENDWVFVTNDRTDFERQYRAQELHPGLIILIGQRTTVEQRAVFRSVLDRIAGYQFVNLAIEARIVGGKVVIEEYEIHVAAPPRPD